MRLYAAASNNHIGITAMIAEPTVNRLVTMAYPDTRDALLANRAKGHRIMLDSGAFSAAKSGHYIFPDAIAREASKPCYDEVVALDDLSCPVTTLRNARHLKESRPDAIVTFHTGEDFKLLRDLRDEFTKIGFGGLVGMHQKAKARWLDRAFSAVWPARVHIFGCHNTGLLMRFPAESADATSWASILEHGFYNSRGASFAGVKQNAILHLREELTKLRELQDDLSDRWRTTLLGISPKGYHDGSY